MNKNVFKRSNNLFKSKKKMIKKKLKDYIVLVKRKLKWIKTWTV
jgi:hypothetical protein